MKNLKYIIKIIKFLISLQRNIISIININFVIFFNRLLKKKIIFFYHPQEKLTLIHTYYIEDLFDKFNDDFYIIFGHKLKNNLGKNYFYLKENYIKYLFSVNYFISNNICDVLIKKSNKIYMHHNIYDDPWVSKDKEKAMCNRLSYYDYIFLSSDKSLRMTKQMFADNMNSNMPKLVEIGYPKIDYLFDRFIKKDLAKKNILIAPTLIDGFREFSIIDSLENLIITLLKKTDYNIILRPHPRDRNNEKIQKIVSSFKKYNKFHYDTSENYMNIYSKCFLLITDVSGTAYTYAFLTSQPIIFFTKNEHKLVNYKYDKLRFFLDRDKVGRKIKTSSEVIENIKYIENNYDSFISSIESLRKNMQFFGKSKKKFEKELNSMNFSINN